MVEPYDVLVAGSYSIDLIFTGLPQFPELGKDVVGTGFDMAPGEAYNSTVALHRLGVKVGWAGDFGNDEFSRLALENARREGLDESLFVHHERPLRRISAAASYPHERAFITYYDPDPPAPAVLRALETVSPRIFYLPGLYYNWLIEPAILKARGMLIVMDGNSNGETLQHPAVHKSIAGADILMPNAAEAKGLTGAANVQEALCQLAEICPLVVVKDGPGGAYAWQEGEVLHAAALALDPVDTTGAGDCFNAGFLRAWLEGLPLTDCLQWGNIVGGLSTLKRGGTGQVTTTQDVKKWLERYPR
jgi:sugar/nucleoside kinase (ribokinase family)